jgi:hypothetical protein
MIERRSGQDPGPTYRQLRQPASLGLACTYQESVEPVRSGAGPRTKQELIEGVDDSMVNASADLWGAGDLASDARDLAPFARAHVQGRVVGATLLQAMLHVAREIAGAAPPAAYARGIERVRNDDGTCLGA